MLQEKKGENEQECATGPFPDVASAYLAASRMPLPFALYLALAGTRITEPPYLVTGKVATLSDWHL